MIELSEDYLEYLHQQALRVLEEKGVEAEEYVLQAVNGMDGISVRGSRLFFDRNGIQLFLTENYQKILSINPQQKQSQIHIGVCDMPQYYMNPHSGKIELMTARSLAEAVKFLEFLQGSSDAVWSMVPGVPRDVPKQLQAITEYYIGCLYCSNGGNVDTMYPEEAIPYLFQMSEAMGTDISSMGMFTISPLKLGGFEMKTAIRHMDRFKSFSVSSLPSPGATAPIFLTAAWIVSIAEVLARAAVIYWLSKGKPVYISAGLFPFEPRKMWMAGGMPEHAIMEYQRSVIAKRYNPALHYSHSLTTSAKIPCAQTMLEKSTGAVFAALHGCREFNTAGLLSFDDIFSPTQFILDLELCDRVEVLIKGQYMPEIYHKQDMDWMPIIEEGLESGYLAADTTLDHYQKAIYFSDILDREIFKKDALLEKITDYDMTKKAAQTACRCIRQSVYQLDRERMQSVTGIFQKAWKELAGGAENPVKNIDDVD